MRFVGGEDVIVTFGGLKRRARIGAVHEDTKTYSVSIDHGNGGFHDIPEVDVHAVDEVKPEEVYQVPNRVPSWY